MMPPSMGDLGSNSLLASLRKGGGAGAVSMLPVLGPWVNSDFKDGLMLSKEEVARLSGVDVGSVRRGTQALMMHGLVTGAATAYQHGKTVTVWRLSPSLASPTSNAERTKDYFYFASTLLHGGNWAQLTHVQRALYLAVGSQAKTFPEPVADNKLLAAALAAHACQQDLLDCYAADPEHPHLRLALLSFTELSAISGISKTALHKAVNAFKRPDSWPRVDGDAAALLHAPLAVYPTDGGSLVYHLRDHAPPWPWDELNRQPEPACAAIADDSEWSDVLDLA
jgi:hypothetical protein